MWFLEDSKVPPQDNFSTFPPIFNFGVFFVFGFGFVCIKSEGATQEFLNSVQAPVVANRQGDYKDRASP